jgi:aminocarboxymuconate-semialdehyde decarboxylase
VERNCFCPQTRIEECDRDGVTIQVLSTVPGIGFNYSKLPERALQVGQFLNDHIAEVVAQHPDRFIGLCTVPMQDVDMSVLELRRCVEDLKMVGVQIGSHVEGRTLDDPMFEPFWRVSSPFFKGMVVSVNSTQECERLDCAIFVHPWDMSNASRLQKHWFPWLLGMPHETAIAMASMMFGGVFERCPRLRICFAHGGGCFPGLIGCFL